MLSFFTRRRTNGPAPGISYVDMDLHSHSARSEVYHPEFLSPLNGVQQGYTFVSVNPPNPIQPPPYYIPAPTPPINPQAGQIVDTVRLEQLYYVDGETQQSFS